MVTELEHRKEFCARTKEARINAGFTQEQISFHLGMERDRYKQYEKRSYLPQYLVSDFCNLTGIDMQWLFTGHPTSLQRLTPLQIRLLRKLENTPTKKIKALEVFLDSLID